MHQDERMVLFPNTICTPSTYSQLLAFAQTLVDPFPSVDMLHVSFVSLVARIRDDGALVHEHVIPGTELPVYCFDLVHLCLCGFPC